MCECVRRVLCAFEYKGNTLNKKWLFVGRSAVIQNTGISVGCYNRPTDTACLDTRTSYTHTTWMCACLFVLDGMGMNENWKICNNNMAKKWQEEDVVEGERERESKREWDIALRSTERHTDRSKCNRISCFSSILPFEQSESHALACVKWISVCIVYGRTFVGVAVQRLNSGALLVCYATNERSVHLTPLNIQNLLQTSEYWLLSRQASQKKKFFFGQETKSKQWNRRPSAPELPFRSAWARTSELCNK